MKATVVILPSLEEQRAAGDDLIIDPEGVNLTDAKDIPVWSNFSYRVPEDVLGRVLAIRLEGGRLVADVDMLIEIGLTEDSPFRFSIAGIPRRHVLVDGRQEVALTDLLQVGLTSKGPASRA